YTTVRAQRLSNASWLTTYSQRGALFSPSVSPVTNTPIQYVTGLGSAFTIADAFMDHALAIGETQISCAGTFDAIAGSRAKVVAPCPPEGGECGMVASNELDARYFECGPLDDLASAMTGLHPADVWVTRLEAELPRSALATDLDL